MELAFTTNSKFTDATTARARRRMVDRWRAEGFHPGRTLHEEAARAAADRPSTRQVFTSAERPSKLSLGELWVRSCSVGAALRRMGVGAGDVVAVQVPNWREAAIAHVAAAAVGAVVLPIVHTYGPADTNWLLHAVRPRILVVPASWDGVDYVERLDAMPASEAIEHVVVVGDDAPGHRLFSDGCPMAGTEVRILHEDGRPCRVGEEGEIALIGPEQFLGYTDPRLNREAFTAEGWLLTGDVGVVDDEEFLTVTDRKKDLVIRGGENISSVEVEEVLVRHPAVAEAAVVASPDVEYGERVCAFVVLRDGATLGLDDVGRHFATQGVQRQKTPELLHTVPDAELPRTPSGKIRKSELRKRLRPDGESASPEGVVRHDRL